MTQMDPYYLQKIKEDLSRRQRRSPGYSLRAYARDLQLHPATLSLMLKGKRTLPLKHSRLIADKLNLGPKERAHFIDSLHQTKTKLESLQVPENDERFVLDESYFSVIAEWEHDAILTLMDCDDFIFSKEEICRRLGIGQTRAEVVLNNLFQCGLLIEDEKGVQKAHPSIRTTEDIASTALRLSHKETLEMGKEKLEEVDVLLRDFSSLLVAIDPTKIPETKTIIREFRQKLMAHLKDGHKTELYQLAIQFYPITKSEEKRSLS